MQPENIETTTNPTSEPLAVAASQDGQQARDDEAQDLGDGSPAVSISLQDANEVTELPEDSVLPVEALAGDR